MITSLQLLLKNKQHISFKAISQSTTDNFIQVAKHLDKNTQNLELQFEHKHLNTILDLSGVSPYVALFFDEDNHCKGASYSLNASGVPFHVQTQYKKVILLPYPTAFCLEDVQEVTNLQP